ncbi:hypothetical protein HDU98_002662 [Podochytrium sp. JEL0797]|nr:hypothetical protein HDU98_002662 [Podochytrium sp. JEL0797]
MHVKIPADLQEEYVEFMRPFIMVKIGDGKQTLKTKCAAILEGTRVDSGGAFVSRRDSIDPAQGQAGNSSQKRPTPQDLEMTDLHGSIKKMRSDQIEPLEGDAIREPHERDSDSNSILRELLPSFDALPKDYKDAIHEGIRQVLEEFKIPVVPAADEPDSSVRVPSHLVDGLKGWLCDQLHMCLPDAQLNDV